MIKFQWPLKRLWRCFVALLSSKKIFSLPRQSKILIYDGAGSAHLLRLLDPINPEILFTRGEELNILILTKALFKRGNILDNYVDEYIGAVKPLVLITWVDNSTTFYFLSKRHPSVKTIFIQNGWRGGVSDVFHCALIDPLIQAKSPKVDVMCTYGEAVGHEYSKYIKGRAVAIGSLLSNEYPVSSEKKIRRIAYISMPIPQDSFAKQSVEAILHELLKYSRLRGIPLTIVGREKPGGADYDNEERYYRELLGWDGEFKKRDGQHSSYKYLDESEVSVSIDTSLGYETVGRGNKNAFFCIYGKLFQTKEFDFGWPAKYPSAGSFWTNDHDPVVFEKILDHLFAINHEQWLSELADCGYANLMIYDSGNVILKQTIAELTSETRHEQA